MHQFPWCLAPSLTLYQCELVLSSNLMLCFADTEVNETRFSNCDSNVSSSPLNSHCFLESLRYDQFVHSSHQAVISNTTKASHSRFENCSSHWHVPSPANPQEHIQGSAILSHVGGSLHVSKDCHACHARSSIVIIVKSAPCSEPMAVTTFRTTLFASPLVKDVTYASNCAVRVPSLGFDRSRQIPRHGHRASNGSVVLNDGLSPCVWPNSRHLRSRVPVPLCQVAVFLAHVLEGLAECFGVNDVWIVCSCCEPCCNPCHVRPFLVRCLGSCWSQHGLSWLHRTL